LLERLRARKAEDALVSYVNRLRQQAGSVKLNSRHVPTEGSSSDDETPTAKAERPMPPLEALHPARARFASGLRAIVAPMPWVHRAVLTAHLHVGSRYETAAENGISHFLEHMLFRGTQRHPSAH